MGTGTAARAGEVSALPPAQAGNVSCNNPMYQGKGPPQTATQPIAPCTQCQQAVQKATEGANGVLAKAGAADKGVASSSSAGAIGTGFLTGLFQQDTQSKSGTVNNIGSSGLTEQQQLAGQVSQAMDQCAQQIESACSGVAAPEDQQAAKQSANSCRASGAQAKQVAAEKGAKAAEMAKNEGTSNGNASKLGELGQLAQAAQGMGQGGGGGSGSGGSGSSGLSGYTPSSYEPLSPTASASDGSGASGSGSGAGESKPLGPTKLGTLNGGEIEGGARQIASIANSGGTDASAGASLAPKTEPASSVSVQQPGSAEAAAASHLAAAGGGANLGVSAGGGSTGSGTGGAGSGSGAAGAESTGVASEIAAASGMGAGEALNTLGSGSGSKGFVGAPYKPITGAMLGLETEGGEIGELVGPASLGGAAGGGGAPLAALSDRHGGLTQKETDETLFARVSQKLRRISTDRVMQ